MFLSLYSPCPSRDPISIWNAGTLYAQHKAQAERFERLISKAQAKINIFKEMRAPKEPQPQDSFETYLYEAQLCKHEARIMELESELAIVMREIREIENEFAQYELFSKCK